MRPNFAACWCVRLFVSEVARSSQAGALAVAPTLVLVGEPEAGQVAAARAAEAERDHGLVARARRGDEQAFALLVARYGQPILSICVASTVDAAEAEDLSQEIFVAAWRHLGRFRGESSFSTWLFALARNACIDRARRARRGPLVGLPDDYADRSAYDHPAAAGSAREVFAAAAELSLPLRQALLLRDVQGLSYEEIAVLQDVPLGTVRSRIAAARAMVAEAIRP